MIQIIILAIIQGITEFLPISSSAHLIIFRDLFNIGKLVTNDFELLFDISLHIGTLLSIIIYFYKDLIMMIKSFFTTKDKFINKLVIATIPAGLLGVLLEDIIANIVRNNLYLISFVLIIVGIIIYFVDLKSKSTKSLSDISYIDSFLIGLSQSLALIPGFSRSGTTIMSLRLLKVNKEDSTKFSFYLSIPIVLGATIYKLLKDNSISLIINNLSVFTISILVSFIVGLLSINLLLNYIKKNNFKLFMWYRILLGLIVISILFIN